MDVDNGADIAGGLVVDTAKVSDLTDNRVVLAGSAGELEDSANLTFDGSTLAVTGALTVSTNATVTGNLTVLGTQSILNTETFKVEDSFPLLLDQNECIHFFEYLKFVLNKVELCVPI